MNTKPYKILYKEVIICQNTKLLEDMAKVIEEFASYMETYAIYSCSEEEWEENRKLIKKLIKKLKKGDPSCLDIDRMNEILDSGHSVLV